MSSSYSILAYWGPRRESPSDCAPKLLHTFKALGDISPALSYWRTNPVGDGTWRPASTLDVETAARWIAGGAHLGDVHHLPISNLGYRVTALNQKGLGPRRLVFSGQFGAYTRAGMLANLVSLFTVPRHPENADIINFRIFKSVLLAFTEIWKPTWCQAIADDLLKEMPRVDRVLHRPRLGGGWITYLAAPFAEKIVPPLSAKCEALNGGILMVATEETFLVENAEHVAIARDIDAALAPFNALPWPPDA